VLGVGREYNHIKEVIMTLKVMFSGFFLCKSIFTCASIRFLFVLLDFLMSTDKLFNYSSDTVLLDIDIHKIFDKHIDALFNQYRKMSDEIFTWGESMMSQIQENRTEQQDLLRQEYDNQQHYLEKKRQEYIDKTHIHKKKKEDEQIRQLMAQCDALKFELAALEYSTRTIPYIKVITQENLAHEQPQRRSKGDQDNETINSVHPTKSSPSKLTYTNIKQK